MSQKDIKTVRKNLGFCGFAAGANGAEVDVRDGKILRIRRMELEKEYTKEEINPWKLEARGSSFEPVMKTPLPPFALVYKKRVYSPNRIPYPLKRIDWDPNGERNPQTRGLSKFVRISWDEAAQIVADEITRIHEQYGPYSILCECDGHGETKVVGAGHGANTQLLRLMGGYTLQVRNPDSWEGWYWGAKHVWGMDPRGSGTQHNLWIDVAQYSETMLFWGADPETTTWGWVGQQPSRLCFWWKEIGIKQVYVCPDLNYGAAIHADKWIPVLPNTDSALHLAIAYMWITEDNYDKEYVDTHVVGFEQFRDYVLGKEDGVPKTPQWASPICGVPVYTIKALARNWANEITGIVHCEGGGMIRSAYSTEPARLEVCLLGMQGVGKPGRCMFKMIEWAGDRFSGPRVVYDHDFMSSCRGYDYTFPAQHIPKTLIPNAILLPEGETMKWWGTTSFIMPVPDQFIEYQYPIPEEDGGSRLHMIWTDTPCWSTCWNNGNRLVEAFRSPRIECIVAQHQWLENDCLLADIILPVSTKFEQLDIGNDVSNGNFTTVFIEEPAIDPVGEAKSDYEAVGEIAKKLGMYEEYSRGFSIEDWMEYSFDESGLNAITSYEELKEKGYYVVPFVEGHFRDVKPGMRPFYEDPEANPLETPTGKLEFVSTNLTELFPDDTERPPMPHFIPYGESNQESLLHERAKDFPYLLMSNHPRWRLHAQLDDVTWLREIPTCKVRGVDGYLYEPVWINPIDAAREGIHQGDIVKLTNERGGVLGAAYVTERIMPGAIYQDHGSRVDPLEIGKLDRGGANNLICPANIISPKCAGEVTNNFLAAIEKVDIEELRRQYPESFARAYDPDAGLLCKAWIVGEGE